MIPRPSRAVLLAAAAAIAASACKSDQTAFDITRSENEPDVFVAGFWWGAGRNQACYWKNGARVLLEDGNAMTSHAFGIAVAGKDVWVAGWHDSVPCVWKNGVRTDLDTAGYAHGLQLFDGKVYVVGTDRNDKAAYWVDGVKTVLTGSYTTSYAYAIQVVPGQIYVGGSCDNVTPCVWDDTGFGANYYAAPATATAQVNGIAGTATAGAWHAAGVHGGQAVTWVYATRTDLPDAPPPSSATGIVLSGSTYLVSGLYTSSGHTRAAWWANGVRHDLPGGADSAASAIAAAGGSVYVSGWTSDGAAQACYWVDGVRYPLEGAGEGWTNAIAVLVK